MSNINIIGIDFGFNINTNKLKLMILSRHPIHNMEIEGVNKYKYLDSIKYEYCISIIIIIYKYYINSTE